MQVLTTIQEYVRQQWHQEDRTAQSWQTLKTGVLMMGTATLLIAQGAMASSSPTATSSAEAVAIHPLLTQAAPTTNGLNDGIYVFGEKPLPDQLQTAYMVFEARAGQVVGAFYAPHSSFDCFQGEVENTRLSLAITETYSQEEYAYNLNLEDTAIAGAGGGQFSIQGFHQLDVASDNDLRMLNTCQRQYSQMI